MSNSGSNDVKSSLLNESTTFMKKWLLHSERCSGPSKYLLRKCNEIHWINSRKRIYILSHFLLILQKFTETVQKRISKKVCGSVTIERTGALTMKGQNIGSSTKKIYKQIFDSDILDIKKQKYMSLGSFKSHAYCSIAKNDSVVVHQNQAMIF